MKNSRIKRGLMVPNNVRSEVLRFFEKMLDRRFSDAERILNLLRNWDFQEEFKKGYIHALEGMLLSSKSGDDRDFFNKFNMLKKDYDKYKQVFKKNILNGNHTIFDQGFFSAWFDLIQYYSKIDK
jgi:hypothetical protein